VQIGCQSILTSIFFACVKVVLFTPIPVAHRILLYI